MITFTKGNLLETRAEALVNTVNTVGVMGKGIALMFKERFPENFRLYSAACKAGKMQTGKVFAAAHPTELMARGTDDGQPGDRSPDGADHQGACWFQPDGRQLHVVPRLDLAC